ncbi:hypothetical protein MUP32_00490 [Candidatus Microgenomates bacterium]|nr:hypothetical protein [Candidatus Microgenomates bacterium]
MKKASCLLLVLLFSVSFAFAEAKDESGQNSMTEREIQKTLQAEQEKEQQQEQEKERRQSAEEKKESEQNETKNIIIEKEKEDQEQSKAEKKPPEKEDVPKQISENAKTQMSIVARKIEEILQSATLQGEIGEQVKQITQEQNKAQNQIQQELGRLESRSKNLKLLVGIDYGAVKNLKKQIEQNRSRIEKLFQLQKQLPNQDDKNIVQETILALIQEDTSLREKITFEEQTKSWFGWFFKFFAR